MSTAPNIFRVIIEVSHLNNSANFYTKLLNITGRAVGGGRYYFDCGSVIFALLETQQNPKPMPQYIYFSVSEIETIYKRATELECLSQEAVHGEPAGEIIHRPWGERSFYAYDPDGNGLCFVDAETIFTGISIAVK